MSPSSPDFTDILEWTSVISLGSIGNAIIGGLSGFFGSLILRRELPDMIALWWIGCLAGVIGGLLHAIFVCTIQRHTFLNCTPDSETAAETWGRGCALILSQSPWWAALGATISYSILVGSPFDPTNELVQRIPFVMVLLTLLAGVLGIAVYATAMCGITGSEVHLLILQNILILMGEDLKKRPRESQDLEADRQIKARPTFLIDADIVEYQQNVGLF